MPANLQSSQAAPAGKTLPAIEAKGLDCGYDGTTILRSISFAVRPAELFFVIGGSGCGKSTLLRHLIGLNPPTAGELYYFGKRFGDQNDRDRLELLRTFGVLFQSGALWSSLTLRENVALPLELHTGLGRRERDQLAAVKLAQVGLQGFEDYFPSEISGGMRKRTGLARALALDPAIVFFDEPSAGLDPVTSRKLDELILSVRDTFGTTCVVVSHELASIVGIGDRFILLDREAKGIVAEGNPREAAAGSDDPKIAEFFAQGKALGAT